jgi:hypothetical protein
LAVSGDWSFSAAITCGYVHVELTIALASGDAEAIPAPALSDNARPAKATTSFVLDSMDSR